MADYTIAEEYKLPSEGKIYSVPFDPKVKLRSMTVQEEMKRQIHKIMNSNGIVKKIIKVRVH